MKFEKSKVVVWSLMVCGLLAFTACKVENGVEPPPQAVVNVKAAEPQGPIVVAKPVFVANLLALDDVSDSADKEEARKTKEKFLVGLSSVRVLHITLVRVGRGNLNSERNNFDFQLPAPPAPPQPDYESLGPIGKTNKALRVQKEEEAAALYEQAKQTYESDYQAAFEKFAEKFLNIDDALDTKADTCINAALLHERLADEAANVSAETLAVIFSDGQFCESKTEPQPVTVKTAIVLYADLSAETESLYQKQLARFFPNAPTVKGVQADRALKQLLNNAEVAQK